MAPTEPQTHSAQELHRKLIQETRALVEVNANFTNIAAGIHVAAEKDEARSKIQSVINGLEYLLDRMKDKS